MGAGCCRATPVAQEQAKPRPPKATPSPPSSVEKGGSRSSGEPKSYREKRGKQAKTVENVTTEKGQHTATLEVSVPSDSQADLASSDAFSPEEQAGSWLPGKENEALAQGDPPPQPPGGIPSPTSATKERGGSELPCGGTESTAHPASGEDEKQRNGVADCFLEDAFSEDSRIAQQACAGDDKTVPRKPPLSSQGSQGSQDSHSRAINRLMSLKSAEALGVLDELEVQLVSFESRTAEIHAALTQPRSEDAALNTEQVSKLKTDLALLESKAHKLETHGVDGVYTGELESGKDDAKARKKDQLQRLEVLFEEIDYVFKIIKARQTS